MEKEGSLPHSQEPTTCLHPAHVSPSYFLKIHFNIIITFTPRSSHQNPVCTSPFPRAYYIPHSSHYPWSPAKYLVCVTGHTASRSSPLLCYLVPLRPKYAPQHPILKHPQPLFLPQCNRPNFTHIQNKRQDYSALPFTVYICGQQTGRQKTAYVTPKNLSNSEALRSVS
jgi:hypothetical protein